MTFRRSTPNVALVLSSVHAFWSCFEPQTQENRPDEGPPAQLQFAADVALARITQLKPATLGGRTPRGELALVGVIRIGTISFARCHRATMRSSLFASVVMLGQIGCQDSPPSSKAHVTTHATMNAEPAPTTATAADCEFDPPPFLVITSQQALLDGVPVDEATFQSALQDKQNTQTLIGGPIKHDLFVQVDTGVPESRVRGFLSNARGAGFTNVTRAPRPSR